jgi:sialate O-acetylesterase
MKVPTLRTRILCAACLLSACAAVPASAIVKVPAVLSDHMVLQRDRPIHIWEVRPLTNRSSSLFRQQTERTKADGLERWSVYLNAEKAGGPFSMTIQGLNTITLSDILMGDVWVASGQSNMEFTPKWG